MARGNHRSMWKPEDHRSYLLVIARAQIVSGFSPGASTDLSDVVQTTLLKAHKGMVTFRGQSEGEFKRWLREILINTCRDACRKQQRQVPIARVRKGVEESSVRLDRFSAHHTSPSHRVVRNEQVLRLSELIENLPTDQRDVVILKHLEDWPVTRIAQHLERSHASVAGLLRRGLANLREQLERE